MAKTLGAAIGIDVGSRTTKIAELRAGRDRHTLTGLAIIPSPREGVDQNGVFDPGSVGAAVRQALVEGGISVKQAIIGISGQSSVVVRMLEVPRMNQNELREHMQWEIQRNIPFAESTIVSDYARVPDPDAPPDAQQDDVVLAVAPQSAIDTLVSVLGAAGLDPVGIDVQPMAMSRTVSLDSVHDPTPIMVVNIGGSLTSIDVFKYGLLSFPRVLPLGGQTFTQAIADYFQIPTEDAEALKRDKAVVLLERIGMGGGAPPPPEPGEPTQAFQPYSPFVDVSDQGPEFEVEPEPVEEPGGAPFVSGGESGTPDAGPPAEFGGPTYGEVPEAGTPTPGAMPVPADDEANRIFDAILPTLEELTSELRRSVEYFRGRGASSEIGRILLAGGGSRLRNLDRFLEAVLGVSVRVYDPTASLHLAVRRYPESYVRDVAPDLAVAIGMALHAFEE